MKEVFAVYDLKSDGQNRSRWVRIGVAFDNKDGSLSVLLDALPLNGRLYIRSRQTRVATEHSDPTSPSVRTAPAEVVALPKT